MLARLHRRPPPPAGFSLAEVLTAVMILTVLLLLSFPAYRSLEGALNRRRAALECGALADAAMAYRRVYGSWPLEDQRPATASADEEFVAAAADVSPSHVTQSNVLAVLTGADRTHNPRGTAFLEPPDAASAPDGTWLDPWGQAYVLVMDAVAGDTRSIVTRGEGGMQCWIVRTPPGDAVFVDSPEPAAAFSWGNPADALAVTNRCIATWRSP